MRESGTLPTSYVSGPLRRFLYLVAAVNGGAILIVEILGAKMLAPFFGTSHFVWTAQITVTLVSLAVGYWFGGRLVDRSASLQRLCWCMLAGAVYLAGTVPLVQPASLIVLRTASLATGAILVAIFLFFVPLTLWAVTGPFLIRVLMYSTTDAGRVVGRLSAISTIGSVAGTLLTSYVLIPFLPYSTTMLLTAGAVAGLALAYFLIWGRAAAVAAVAVSGLLVPLAIAGYGSSFGGALEGFHERARATSEFGLLQVLEHDDSGVRYLFNDLLMQNSYDPAAKQSVGFFTFMMYGLATTYAPSVERVLCIGMGVGIVPGRFARDGKRVDVVEINPAVVRLAHEHFELDLTRLHLTVGDGRYFVHTQPDGFYDVVVLDAFLGDSSPTHLMTREAFADIHRVLTPNGVLVVNSFGRFDAGRDFLATSLDRTLRAVFRSVAVHASASHNVFYVASDQTPLTMHRPFPVETDNERLQGEIDAAVAGVVHPAADRGMVLTDDYNPVEYRDAANREELRRELAHVMTDS